MVGGCARQPSAVIGCSSVDLVGEISVSVEKASMDASRPPLPAGATTVLVTTTARSEKLGHGYALWVYVVDDGGPKIAEFGGAS
jgi:hypothetical protein